MWRHPIRDADLRRLLVDAFVPAIYLGAFAVPPIGSILLWRWARAWTGEPGLVWHLAHALRIQLAGWAAIAVVQALVIVTVWLAGPTLTDGSNTHLRQALFLADACATLGVWLATGLLGPVLLRAYGREIAVPAAERHVPTPRPVRAPRPIPIERPAPLPDPSEDGLVAYFRRPPASATFGLSAPLRFAVGADATRRVEPPG